MKSDADTDNKELIVSNICIWYSGSQVAPSENSHNSVHWWSGLFWASHFKYNQSINQSINQFVGFVVQRVFLEIPYLI